MVVGRWRSVQGRPGGREALERIHRSYSSSSYFSNHMNKFPLTYDIELIDDGFTVGSEETALERKKKVDNRRP
jgi:hypothetical protein